MQSTTDRPVLGLGRYEDPGLIVLLLLYAVTMFAGAALLFVVQPMTGKTLLPQFGGGAGVWTTTMLFFQVMLLAGYGYVHVLTTRLAHILATEAKKGMLQRTIDAQPPRWCNLHS